MANRKVTFKFDLPGVEQGRSSEDGSSDMPSVAWVRRNKNSSAFKMIVENTWKDFIREFSIILKKSYKRKAQLKLNRTSDTKETYNRWKTYKRAYNIPGSKTGTKEPIRYDGSDTNKGFLSGLLYSSMDAKLLYDGNNITILSPMTNAGYKALLSTMTDQPGLKSYHLSKFLEEIYEFNTSGRDAWDFETQGFKPSGILYRKTLADMNRQLAKLERSRKRGSYKKRR